MLVYELAKRPRSERQGRGREVPFLLGMKLGFRLEEPFLYDCSAGFAWFDQYSKNSGTIRDGGIADEGLQIMLY